MTNKLPHPERVSMWGCFSGRGIGNIEIFTGMLDADMMKRILQTHLLPSANRLFPVGRWWFQWDNDPKHTSKKVSDWLFNKGIQLIDFPPYSPGLNPIENLLSDLKRRVERRNAQNTEQLILHIKEDWEGTSREVENIIT